MPAPFDVPETFQGLVPQTNEDKCTALNKALLQVPLRLWQLLAWMFTGTAISDGFRAQVWPVGASFETYATGTPTGRWLECLGQAVDRDDFSDLFAAIGTTYGDGDGSTTFNLPNRSGRSPIGAGTLDDDGDPGATYSQGQQIGEEDVVLIMANLPAEPAPLGAKVEKLIMKRSAAVSDDSDASNYAVGANADVRGRQNGHTDHTENVMGDLGTGQAHENRSPSLVLRCWIAY